MVQNLSFKSSNPTFKPLVPIVSIENVNYNLRLAALQRVDQTLNLHYYTITNHRALQNYDAD